MLFRRFGAGEGEGASAGAGERNGESENLVV